MKKILVDMDSPQVEDTGLTILNVSDASLKATYFIWVRKHENPQLNWIGAHKSLIIRPSQIIMEK